MKNLHTSFTLLLRILPVFLSGIMAAHAQNLTWQNAVSPANGTWTADPSVDKNWKDDSNNTSSWVDGRDAIINGNAQTITVNGTVSLGNLARTGGTGHITVKSGTVNFGSLTTVTVIGNTSNILFLESSLTGSNGFTKEGSGVLRITKSNTGLSGPVTLNLGTLSITSDNALGSGAVTLNGGTLEVRDSSVVANAITANGGKIESLKSNKFTNAITLDSNLTMTLKDVGNTQIQGGIVAASGDKTLNLVGDGNNSGNNGTYTIDTHSINLGAGGQLNIYAGAGAADYSTFTTNLNVGGNTFGGLRIYNRATLKLGADNAVPTGTSLTLGISTWQSNTAGMATMDLNDHNLEVGSLASSFNSEATEGAASNRVITNSAVGDVKTFTVNQTTNTTFRGELRGNLALTKEGAGTLILSEGNNTFTGNTHVSAGTLSLNGTATLTNTPVISVASGANFNVSGVSGGFAIGSTQTLKGTGSVIGGTEILGTLAPGNSIGVISMEDLTIGSTGTLDVELGRSSGAPLSDRVDVTGTVTVDSGANLKLTLYTGLDNPEQGDVFFLVNNDSTDAVSGVFTKLNGVNTTLNQGSVFSWNALSWEISYEADFGAQAFAGGNDIAIRVIPEPATWLLVGIGFGMILFRRPRRDQF